MSSVSRSAGLPAVRQLHLALTAVLAAAVVVLVYVAIDVPVTHPVPLALVLALSAANALWLSAGAVTALIGRAPLPAAPDPEPQPGARPGPCAALWLICGEDPAPLAARARALLAGLAETGQADCAVFVLSDTSDPEAVARERAAFAGLGLHYRNRPRPVGRKPGNLRDWLDRHGAGFETMLVLDADSSFSARRLLAMRRRMAADPRLGLIQAGSALRPGTSRFVRLQRLSARLGGPIFGRGLARISGTVGPYYGHNALIRVRAFAPVAALPPLPGPAPWGGAVLSHDFVEAAFMARTGWRLAFEPETRGSHEDAPETLAAHGRRDRRWAQGNLQHLRLLGARRLRPESRLNLTGGIMGYVASPVWLALVVLFGAGAVHAQGFMLAPFAAMMALLLVPKAAAALGAGTGRNTPWRRRVRLRAMATELGLSTLVAPLLMMRQSAAVAQVALGRDSGWRPAGARAPRPAVPGRAGRAEALAGAGLLVAVVVPQLIFAATPAAALFAGAMVLPLAAPLLAAPWLIAWLDAPARPRGAVAEYYDASTRRFLAVGGSGGALAIHRPLWDAGVASPEQAAARVNALVAEAAQAALGRAPAQVSDLGCGVGGTLFHLARAWPEAALSGITISAVQVDLARRLADAQGLAGRCRFVQSDFTHSPMLPAADLAVAIESHVHAPSAAGFLSAARAHLGPGGVLVVVDDMLARPEPDLTAPERRLVETFRRGWRLGHVPSAEGLVAEARGLGFEPVENRDLSPLLRLDRWRDRALTVVAPLADALGLGRWPLFANMIGGNALTVAHRRGLMQYRLVVLRRTEAAAAAPERSAA